MNVRAEVEALEFVANSLPERARNGEFTVQDLKRIGPYLMGRVTLIKRHVATMEAVRFYNEVEADLAELPVQDKRDR